uniref:Pentatricopeptide repeat-containing protein n=1 Tax=Talaromyces marneffei PM1 TaxID=1077442 RepID=A0A093UWN8_TALMA
MLERAVGCLEFAGQGVLHKYGGVLRSQKTLDPTFWKHQFSDADSSPWQSGLHHQSNPGPPAPIVTQSSPDFFLDFLYPRRCLVSAAAWASKIRKGNVNIHKRRRVLNFARSYSQTPRSRTRPVAHGVSQGNISRASRRSHASEASHHLANIENIGSNTISRTRLHRDYDRASLDVERAIGLLEDIDIDKRSANDYEIMLQPLLEAGHLPAVERLCDDAVAKDIDIDVWSLATKIAIQCTKWRELSYIWNKKHVDLSNVLPSTLASVSDLPSHFDSFLAYLEENSATLTDLQLASDVLDFVFESDKIMRDMIVESALSLTRRSANLGFLQQSHYNRAIQTLLKIGKRASRVFSMVLYRNFRWHLSTCKPTKTLLHQLLGMLAEMKTHYGVQYLLDEFSHFYKQPSIGAYNYALLAFSRSGDVPKTQETFNKMVELYGTSTKNPDVGHKTPRTPRWVLPVIHAHARMADYPSAEYEFHRIAHVYKVQQSRHCWNALISAHANARNVRGAFRVWRRMQRKGVPPDWYTYGTLMGMCARLGDVENTIALCKMAEKMPGKMPVALMDTVVEAYCRNQRFQEAEDMAERCLALSLSGSRTRMWNVLLYSHALRADLDSVSRIQTRMKEAGIEFDEMTYAAIMLCFVVIGQPNSARRLLRGLQRGRRIQATEFHYTLVLYGYVQQGNRDMIYLINKEMEQRFKNPGLSARVLMLRATLQRDTFERLSPNEDFEDSGYRLALSEDLLFKAVFNFDQRQFASKYPRPGTSGLPVHEAFPSVLYEPVLQAYSAEGMYRRTQLMLREYAKDLQASLASDKRTVVPSLRFLSVLMEVYSQDGNFEAVQKCWDLSLRRAGKMLIRSPVSPAINPPVPKGNVALPGVAFELASDTESQSTSHGGEEMLGESIISEDPASDLLDEQVKAPHYPAEESIIPSQRFILSRHFSIYISMVGKAGQSSSLSEIVDDFQKRGFSMSSQNWLTYVRTLATSNTASEQLEAFATFERIFMPHFPGWRLLARGSQLRPPGVPSAIDLLDKRPIGKFPELLGKKSTRLWTKLNPTWMHPTYNVMIYLAATLKDFNERSLTEGREQLDTLSSVAPLTLDAIAMMPHLRERFQGILLRNQVEQGDLTPQQRRKYIWTGGILGIGGKKRLDHPLEEADAVSEELETELGPAFDSSQSEILDVDDGEPEEHMKTTEPIIAPEDEHDIETEILIESTRRELGIDPIQEEELSDKGRE